MRTIGSLGKLRLEARNAACMIKLTAQNISRSQRQHNKTCLGRKLLLFA